ncbi:MAG TPA: ribulose-phosphate 3-epimerase [Geminicoccus sp.]|jgi:ribulose-phosphate 3-epimerase|uniref:ribulose-phosphate 3-epimerase n=1 Tax=Geminicoccus sp. TaxID=2024832 RepID=UPI002E335AB2|nr:ribulose-phosphate 3-epimerase [Geminicoccus sp.]HEX2525154.1 ribulose-phosphate 3-epimerase [Geminicoccus sp.]
MAQGTIGSARYAGLPRNRLLAEFSLWSADLANLEADVKRAEGHADLHHLDVADGHFAPALLFFPDLVARLRKLTDTPFHVHLMTTDDVLASQADQFAEAGADLVSVHAENGRTGLDVLERMKAVGVRTGVVAKVETELTALAPFLPVVDMVTLLGTRIGVKGQDLDPDACARLEQAASMLRDVGRRDQVLLAADGGIREHTVPKLRAAGADTVVMGSLAFGALDLGQRMRWSRGL